MSWAPFLTPNRDDALKQGRAKGGGVTFYSIPGVAVTGTQAVLTASTNKDYYAPWFAVTPLIIDQMACQIVSSTTGNLRMGFYAADADWQPLGAPMTDSGNIAITTAVKTYTPAAGIYIPRGRYVSVWNCDTACDPRLWRTSPPGSALVSALGASPFPEFFEVDRTYGAFPTPGTAWTTGSGATLLPSHIIVFRVMTP